VHGLLLELELELVLLLELLVLLLELLEPKVTSLTTQTAVQSLASQTLERIICLGIA